MMLLKSVFPCGRLAPALQFTDSAALTSRVLLTGLSAASAALEDTTWERVFIGTSLLKCQTPPKDLRKLPSLSLVGLFPDASGHGVRRPKSSDPGTKSKFRLFFLLSFLYFLLISLYADASVPQCRLCIASLWSNVSNVPLKKWDFSSLSVDD